MAAVWVTILLVVCSSGVAWGCPNCKDGIAATESAEAQRIARGYALSILIMLAMPFTLAGSFGLYVWREMRRLERDGRDGVVASDLDGASGLDGPVEQAPLPDASPLDGPTGSRSGTMSGRGG